MGDMVLEFEVVDSTVTLTQVAVDESGQQSATKTTIHADGQDHPGQFGHELVLPSKVDRRSDARADLQARRDDRQQMDVPGLGRRSIAHRFDA